MEHLIIRGGEKYLPLARKFLAKLKRLGLPYASSTYLIGDSLIRVRVTPGHDYIDIGGEPPYLGWGMMPASGPTADDPIGAAPSGYVPKPPSPTDDPNEPRKQVPLTDEIVGELGPDAGPAELSNRVYVTSRLRVVEEARLNEGAALWSNGKKDRVLLGAGFVSYKQRRIYFPDGSGVLGGAIAKAGGKKWLVVAVQGGDFATTFYAVDRKLLLVEKPVTNGNSLVERIVIGSAPSSSVAMRWRFSPDGLKAVALETKDLDPDTMCDIDGDLVESEFLEYGNAAKSSITGVQHIHRVTLKPAEKAVPGEPPFTVKHEKETRENAVLKVVPVKTFMMGMALREYSTQPGFAYSSEVEFRFSTMSDTQPTRTAAGFNASEYPELPAVFALFPTGDITNAILNPSHPDYNNPSYYFIDPSGNRRSTRYFVIAPDAPGDAGGTYFLHQEEFLTPPLEVRRWHSNVDHKWVAGPVADASESEAVTGSAAVLAAQEFFIPSSPDYYVITEALDAFEEDAAAMTRDATSFQLTPGGDLAVGFRTVGAELVRYRINAERLNTASKYVKCSLEITYKFPYTDKRTLDWSTKTTLHYGGARILDVGYSSDGTETTLELVGRVNDKVEYLSTQKSYAPDPAKTDGLIDYGINHEYTMTGSCGYDLVLGGKVLKSHVTRASASRVAPTAFPNATTAPATETTEVKVESFTVEDFDIFNEVVLVQEFSRIYAQDFGPDAEDGIATDDGEVTMIYASGEAVELYRTEPRTAALESYDRSLEFSTMCRVLALTDSTSANQPLRAKELPPVSGVQFLQSDTPDDGDAKLGVLTGEYTGAPMQIRHFGAATARAHGFWRIREAASYRSLPQLDGVIFPVIRDDLGYDPAATRKLFALNPDKWLVHIRQNDTPDKGVFYDGSGLLEKFSYVDPVGAKFDDISFIA